MYEGKSLFELGFVSSLFSLPSVRCNFDMSRSQHEGLVSISKKILAHLANSFLSVDFCGGALFYSLDDVFKQCV